MARFDILVVEDDVALCEALSDTLAIEGYRVCSANNGANALVKLEKHQFRLVVSDVQMPVMDGLQLLQNIRKRHEQLPVLLMTAYGTVPSAVQAIQAGAVDYLQKPFEAQVLVARVAELAIDEPIAESAIVVHDNAMKKIYQIANRVAKAPVTVLLQGESGTGKEVVARYIHDNSLQSKGPFEAINCAAIPENMLEAILFGYEKGAFTGACQATPGKFEQAQNGTLLLDEISEMDLSLQAKLLRVLQEKELERLGGNRKIALAVRVIATTNRRLRDSVAQGLFREDLFYRLNVFPITLPPLRDRRRDIVPIAESLIKRHWAKAGNCPGLGETASRKLQQYDWPGNVRELENVVHRALILHDQGDIDDTRIMFEEDTQQPLSQDHQDTSPSASVCNLGDGVRSVEEKIILQTLQQENGSRKDAAEKLGISPRTLRYKLARMKESGIAVPC